MGSSMSIWMKKPKELSKARSNLTVIKETDSHLLGKNSLLVLG